MDREVICKLVIVESYNKNFNRRRLTKEAGKPERVFITAESASSLCDREVLDLFDQESSSRIGAKTLISCNVGKMRE